MSKPFAVAPTTLVRDFKGFEYALHMAYHAEYPIRVGCVAYHNNKRLAGAFNTLRNSSVNSAYGTATYHAEHNVVRMVPDRFLPKATIYIARLSKDETEMPSRPCRRCLTLLAEMSVPEVVYLSQEGKVVKEYI